LYGFSRHRKRKRLSRNSFVKVEITTRELNDKIPRGCRKDFVAVGIAVVFEPKAEKLFVHVLRFLPGFKTFFEGLFYPVATGIGRVDFID
jgi:hypothetical protein